MDNDPTWQEAEARAQGLSARAERYRGLAAQAAEPETTRRLHRIAQEIEAEAAIEKARAALLRNVAADEDGVEAAAESRRHD